MGGFPGSWTDLRPLSFGFLMALAHRQSNPHLGHVSAHLAPQVRGRGCATDPYTRGLKQRAWHTEDIQSNMSE